MELDKDWWKLRTDVHFEIWDVVQVISEKHRDEVGQVIGLALGGHAVIVVLWNDPKGRIMFDKRELRNIQDGKDSNGRPVKKDGVNMDHPGARNTDMSLVDQIIREARADYSERENLQALIDQALDNRDEQEFYRLAAKLL